MAVVVQGKVSSVKSFPLDDVGNIVRWIGVLPSVDAGIISNVSEIIPTVTEQLSLHVPLLINLTADTPVPVTNRYKTPQTLGKDRLAAVVGAYSLYPGRNVLVLDAGTALTVDFLDADGNYWGGNISPGLEIRFRALHDYTKKLPLCRLSENHAFIGNSTESAIVAGVQNGMILEIEGYIERLNRQYSELVTVITGGDAFFLVNKIEKPIFAKHDLVLIGLDQIVKYNIIKNKN